MVKILGIESSCDETAAAVVGDGRKILSSVVASQIELHQPYGGVFPEIASRQHVLSVVPVIRQAMEDAAAHWSDLAAVAVTYGPGLAGSLLVGVNAAKAIAWAQGLPLVGVNHLEGHIYANWLQTTPEPLPPPPLPLVVLIVSGGHTELLAMRGHGHYERLGGTLDDAAGEAFDKVARLLELGYPGGPAIQKAAEGGNPKAFRFPRARLGGGYDFSFSGLKTAVLRTLEELRADPRARRRPLPLADLAASFQAAVVDILVEKTQAAAEEVQAREVLLAGGVAANAALRAEARARLAVPLRVAPPSLCTDNAAMIAAAGHFAFAAGRRSGLDLDVVAGARLT
ncbi:MAG: tRNA (adenosine(37)-N6)-threonylcarbamoyltransferase complex transferase subunit TsaD [Chloroflexi bacterium]|nr:tRNA (adenosine(37)-N6)-threonylcarbamoyltransferase complex transferase subunit TsaD [Chloroflexota bacterium]